MGNHHHSARVSKPPKQVERAQNRLTVTNAQQLQEEDPLETTRDANRLAAVELEYRRKQEAQQYALQNSLTNKALEVASESPTGFTDLYRVATGKYKRKDVKNRGSLGSFALGDGKNGAIEVNIDRRVRTPYGVVYDEDNRRRLDKNIYLYNEKPSLDSQTLSGNYFTDSFFAAIKQPQSGWDDQPDVPHDKTLDAAGTGPKTKSFFDRVFGASDDNVDPGDKKPNTDLEKTKDDDRPGLVDYMYSLIPSFGGKSNDEGWEENSPIKFLENSPPGRKRDADGDQYWMVQRFNVPGGVKVYETSDFVDGDQIHGIPNGPHRGSIIYSKGGWYPVPIKPRKPI